MATEYFYHKDGVLYEDDIPQAVSYDKEIDIQYTLTPLEEHKGNLEVFFPTSDKMNYVVPVENSNYCLGNPDLNWSKNNPLQVNYTVNSTHKNISGVDLVDEDTLEAATEELFGSDFDSQTPEEIVEKMDQEFDYQRKSTFERQEFLEERKGVCDQFSELMSLARPEWIKHNGYGRPGDINLESGELEFTSHAWVLNTVDGKVYDPAPVISDSNPTNPDWVRRDPETYFLRLPEPRVKIDGSHIPKILQYKDEPNEKNYGTDASLQRKV